MMTPLADKRPEQVIAWGVIRVETTDGERRWGRVWPGGGWSCPFCGGANDPSDEWYQRRAWPYPCGNPACIAGGHGSPEAVAERRLALRVFEEATAERESTERFNARVREEARARQDARIAEANEKSRAEGWCMSCWSASTGWGRWMSSPKKIRHRAPENCPQRRRGR